MNQNSSEQLSDQLFEAVYNEDIDRVEELINEGADVNSKGVNKNIYGYDPISVLCVAVEKNNEELVRALLENPNIDVNLEDNAGATALHRATIYGFVEIVEALLATKIVHVNIGSKRYGSTPLHLASRRGHDDVVEALLKYPGIQVNQKDYSGKTALHLSAGEGHIEVVDMLLDVPGILVNEKDELHFHTPLHLAADFRHEEVVDALLSHPDIDVNVKDKYGQTPLHTSAYHGDLKVVQMLLEAGIDASEKKKDGQTAVYWAAKQGNTKVVEAIVNHIKDVTASGRKDGKSSQVDAINRRAKRIKDRKEKMGGNRNANDPNAQLLLGVRNNDLEKVRELLKIPTVDVNSTDKNKNTSLHLASHEGHTEMVKMLLRVEGIDVNAKNRDKRKLIYPIHPGDNPARAKLDTGKTPLHLAVDSGRLEVVKVLMDHPEIDVNSQDKYSDCPLMSAVKYSQIDMIETLLGHPKIDVNVADVCNDHFTFLHTAVEKGNIEIVKMLLSHPNIDVNLKDKYYCCTPLHMAVRNNNLQIVEAILSHPKVDVNAIDKFYKTSLQDALEKGNSDIVERLREANGKINVGRYAVKLQ